MLDADANRDLFEEQVDIIMKAFNSESFSHEGKNYTIPPRVPYRGYELGRDYARARAGELSRRMLAACR